MKRKITALVLGSLALASPAYAQHWGGHGGWHGGGWHGGGWHGGGWHGGGWHRGGGYWGSNGAWIPFAVGAGILGLGAAAAAPYYYNTYSGYGGYRGACPYGYYFASDGVCYPYQ